MSMTNETNRVLESTPALDAEEAGSQDPFDTAVMVKDLDNTEEVLAQDTVEWNAEQAREFAEKAAAARAEREKNAG